MGSTTVPHPGPAASNGRHDAPAPGWQPALSTRGLVKTFGRNETKVTALAGVTLDIPARTFTAIMGPSGSGKSTLLHCLAGLESADSGEIWIAGEQIVGMKDRELTRLRRDRLGFVFQSFNLVPTLSAADNIVLPFRLAGKKPDAAILNRLTQRLGLEGRLGHKPGELSGGQQQRVAIARALLGSPDVIFADEPTGALDSTTSADVLSLLRECVDVDRQTIVMVTHDDAAASAADRIVRMSDGQVAL